MHLVIRPARVQGEGAAADIARGLQAVAAVPRVDVVIVGRGGGSIEDLWAFNEEVVARAIAASPVPVISAVGHETDFTIADFVADLRAPTPSAAAEMVVAGQEEFRSRIDGLAGRATAAIERRIERLRDLTHRLSGRPGLAGWPARIALAGRAVAEMTHQLGRTARALVARRERRYHELRLALETYDLRRQIGAVRTRLTRADAALKASALAARTRADARFCDQAARLESLTRSPCSGAATRCAGTRTARASFATRRSCGVATASASRCTAASWPAASRGTTEPGMHPMDTTIKDFEAAIAELEGIVKKLEEGDLPLETSLALYERGVQLSRFCHARLEEAERRIEVLDERGELKPAPASLADLPAGDESNAKRTK